MRRRAAFLHVAMLCSIATHRAVAQSAPAGRAAIAGRWYGTSICVDTTKYPACRHERVRYDFHRDSTGSPGLVVTADKFVAGAWDNMADVSCVPANASPEWTCEFTLPRAHGVFAFRPAGAAMSGILSGMPSKELIRRIDVRRDSAEGFRLPLP